MSLCVRQIIAGWLEDGLGFNRGQPLSGLPFKVSVTKNKYISKCKLRLVLGSKQPFLKAELNSFLFISIYFDMSI